MSLLLRVITSRSRQNRILYGTSLNPLAFSLVVQFSNHTLRCTVFLLDYRKFGTNTNTTLKPSAFVDNLDSLCRQNTLLEALERLESGKFILDFNVYVCILKTCLKAKENWAVKRVRDHIVQNGFQADRLLCNFLVDAFGKCGNIEDAFDVFRGIEEKNIFSWNAMIAAYAQQGYAKQALQLLLEMQLEDVKPNDFTFVGILASLPAPESLAVGKLVHACIDEGQIRCNVYVSTALANMYGKCKSLMNARSVFDKIHVKNVVSWTSIIAAYSQNGKGKEAVNLYREMCQEGVEPNKITFISIFDACANTSGLEEGEFIHQEVIKRGLDSDIVIGTAIIDMYGKCGNLEAARTVFEKMPTRDVVCWTAMLAAYAQNGQGENALCLFQRMHLENTKPNNITFIHVLSACSHSGLNDGWYYFFSVTKDHGLIPLIEHYGCVVDLLARQGCLAWGEDFINNMPLHPAASTLLAFLGACRMQGDIEKAERTAEQVYALDPRNAAPFVLLSHMYSVAGMWDKVAMLWKFMESKGLKKPPGRSAIQVNMNVHEFLSGDNSHPRSQDIYAELEILNKKMEEAGYVPDITLVPHDVDAEAKKSILRRHSEKLAIAFGLISLPVGKPIRIIKNLRVCPDCHTATKFISKIVGREIVVRDAIRFHHFKNGMCSCCDYW